MTAKEFLNSSNSLLLKSLNEPIGQKELKRLLVEFAKLKVQECKEAIHNNAYVEFLDEQGEPFDYTDVLTDDKIGVQVNPDSILNSYNIEE